MIDHSVLEEYFDTFRCLKYDDLGTSYSAGCIVDKL
jgi:hypothetical protein